MEHLKTCDGDCTMCAGGACALCGAPRPRTCQHSITFRHAVGTRNTLEKIAFDIGYEKVMQSATSGNDVY